MFIIIVLNVKFQNDELHIKEMEKGVLNSANSLL